MFKTYVKIYFKYIDNRGQLSNDIYILTGYINTKRIPFNGFIFSDDSNNVIGSLREIEGKTTILNPDISENKEYDYVFVSVNNTYLNLPQEFISYLISEKDFKVTLR